MNRARAIQPMILALMLSLGGTFAQAGDGPDALEGIAKLRIVMSKLSETLKANKDIESLKELGMPEQEVIRLQKALDMKVKQLTEDTVYVIRSI